MPLKRLEMSKDDVLHLQYPYQHPQQSPEVTIPKVYYPALDHLQN